MNRKSTSKETPVIILGGGISGLATAWYLHKKQIPFKLIEKEPKTGGKIHSEILENTVFDFGPNSIRDKTGEFRELADELSISEDMIEISEAFKTRFLVRDGKLIKLAPSLKTIFSTILSTKGKFRILKEPFIPAAPVRDESVGLFLERRIGKEAVDYLVDPIFSGIYAGDIYKLSKSVVMPKIAAMEHKYGSILKGSTVSKRAKKASQTSSAVITFKKGLQQLPEAISNALSDSIIHEEITEVNLTSEGYLVRTNEKSYKTGKIISCLPANALANVLSDEFAALSMLLNKVEYSPIVSTQLIYERSQLEEKKEGFGFLVPRKEHLQLLGAIWKSSIFPELSSSEAIHFTILSGGAHHPDIHHRPIQELEQQLTEEFSSLMNISEQPKIIKSKMWPNAIPQFNVGYEELRGRIRKEENRFTGLTIGANFMWGASVPECVEAAKKLSETFSIN